MSRAFPFATGARPDPPDDRDLKFDGLPLAGAALVDMPAVFDNRPLFGFPAENQETDPVCVGMAIAGAQQAVYGHRFSWRWPYVKAQLEDYVEDDPDEPYGGTTGRAGLHGWLKHLALLWGYWPSEPHEPYDINIVMWPVGYPLTRYERLDISITGIQTAIQTHRCVLATSEVHSGWRRPNRKHRIRYSARYRKRGWHFYLIVGWDDPAGYWLVRNSWGVDWGDQGYAWLKYDDFIANTNDVWVAIVENA